MLKILLKIYLYKNFKKSGKMKIQNLEKSEFSFAKIVAILIMQTI